MTVTAQTLCHIYGVNLRTANIWVQPIRAALALAECNTKTRTAYWLAQVGHESGRLKYTTEIWGPTPQQKKYEPGAKLAARLGNSEPGDGARYKGRGLIQVTGRANYALMTVKLREVLDEVPDFEAEPELLALASWAALTAGMYWKTKRLNKFVDLGDFAEVTRRINGGYNGLADRQALLTKALMVL